MNEHDGFRIINIEDNNWEEEVGACSQLMEVEAEGIWKIVRVPYNAANEDQNVKLLESKSANEFAAAAGAGKSIWRCARDRCMFHHKRKEDGSWGDCCNACRKDEGKHKMLLLFATEVFIVRSRVVACSCP